MKRSIRLTLVTAACAFLFIAEASAVEFSIVGPKSATVLPGEEVTISIVTRNPSGRPFLFLAASVSGYGANEFVRGEAVDSVFNTLCIAPFMCFGGAANLVGPALSEDTLGSSGPRVPIVLFGLTGFVSGREDIDQGLDGLGGTAQFAVTLRAVESAWIDVGTVDDLDGVLFDGNIGQENAVGDVFFLNVIPEPGTALLMGLGLALLSSRRSSRGTARS